MDPTEGRSPFLITPLPGFTPNIGRLVCMMEYARRTTLQAVSGLTPAQLDWAQDAESNTIGALLAHIAGVEAAYQQLSFRTGEDGARGEPRWLAAVQLGPRAREEIRGQPLEHYVRELADIRAVTLRELAQRTDAWLDEADTPGAVAVTCTPSGGAQSVRLELSPEWPTALSDTELLSAINTARSAG